MPRAKKNDKNKPMVALIDPWFLEDMAKVLTLGKNKYGIYNWQNGMDIERIESALLRHYIAHKKGEFRDKESGIAHVSHIAVNAMFLHRCSYSYIVRYCLSDIAKGAKIK